MVRRKDRKDVFAELEEDGTLDEMSEQAQTETTSQETATQSTKRRRKNEDVEDGEDAELTEKFGPVDPDIKSLGEVSLVDLYDAKKANGEGKWKIIEFEYKPDFGAFGGNNSEPTYGHINLNIQSIEDPDAQTPVYVDDEKRKERIDALIDYAFGKYDVHNFEDLKKLDAILDTDGYEDNPTIKFNVYQNIIKSEKDGNERYQTIFQLTNRHRQGGFLRANSVTAKMFKDCVANDGYLDVDVIKIVDNEKVYEKKDEDGNVIDIFPFAQFEVYFEYEGETYMSKYSYLHRNGPDKVELPKKDQKPDYGQKAARISQIADKLNIHGDNVTVTLAQIGETPKSIPAKVKVSESNFKYQRGDNKGKTVYYAKLVK